MEELSRFLLENLVIDFSGEVTSERVADMLRRDGTQAARVLLTKIVKPDGLDDFLITLADVLKEELADGVDAEHIREQVRAYTDS